MTKLFIENNQSLIDIALQVYGNADAVFDLLKANNLSLEASVPAGTELILPEISVENKDISQYFSRHNTRIATDAYFVKRKAYYFIEPANVNNDDIFDDDYNYEIDYWQIIMDNLSFSAANQQASLYSTILVFYTIKNNNTTDVEFQVFINGNWENQTIPATEYSGFNFDYYNEAQESHNIDVKIRLKDMPNTERTYGINILYTGKTIRQILEYGYKLIVNGTTYPSGSEIEVPLNSWPRVGLPFGYERFIFYLKLFENGEVIYYSKPTRYYTGSTNNIFPYIIIDKKRTIEFVFVTPTGEEIKVSELTFKPI